MTCGQHAVRRRIAAMALVTLMAASGCATYGGRGSMGDTHWVASWGSAQLVPDVSDALPDESWRDASIRQIVRASLAGSRLRVRVSNVFGTAPLVVDGASIARAVAPGQPGIEAASVRTLTFAGRGRVVIPARAEYYSDPVELRHPNRADLAVSLYFMKEPARQTGHPGSRATTFVTRGNRLAGTAWPAATRVERWYQLADVEVEAPASVGVVVAIGDSITDGHGATTDGNDRWTDFLAARFAREGLTMGVVNAGIGGNRLLRDGTGPNLAARFDRDVLARSGATHAIVLIGVNDLGGQHRNGDDTPAARAELVEELLQGYRQIVARAHAHHVCVVGGTILPYNGSDYYQPGADNESDRLAINAWIRTSGVFDAVADFDAAVRDPARPDRMRPEDDTGDHLHPSPAGFRAMAEAVPLSPMRDCFLSH